MVETYHRNFTGCFNCDLLETSWLGTFEMLLKRSCASSQRCTPETSWRRTSMTSLGVSFETSLKRCGRTHGTWLLGTFETLSRCSLMTLWRRSTDTSWRRTTKRSLGVSFKTSLRCPRDVLMARRCYVPLRRCHYVP